MMLITYIALFILTPIIIFNLTRNIFNPIAFFCIYIFIGVYLRSLVLTNSESEFGGTFWETVSWQLTSHLETSLILLSATILLTLIFCAIPFKRKNINNFIARTFEIKESAISVRRLTLISVFFLISYLTLLSISQGGLGLAISILQKRSLVFDSEVFYIKIINIFFCTAVLISFYCKRTNPKSFTAITGFFTSTLIIISLALLFLIGGRGAFLTQLLSLIFIYHITERKKGAATLLLPIIIAASVLCSIIFGLVIREAAQKDLTFDEALQGSTHQIVETVTGTFPIIDLFTSARYYADQTGHDYGIQFVNYFTRIIPRSIWPEKPLISGLEIRKFYSGHTLSGVPPTIFGEFYIAFGVIGLIICSIVLSLFLRFLSSLHQHSQSNTGLSLLYITLLIQMIFSSLRAGLEISIFTLIYYLTAIIIVKFLTYKHQLK